MDREAFEQLVSAWLDEPTRADLRVQLEAAARSDAQLAATWDEWRRMADVLRAVPPAVRRIDWPRVQARIAAAIDEEQAAADGRLDALLGDAGPAAQVDWSRLRGRISAAVAGDEVTRLRRRRRVRWVLGAVSGVSAAAAGLFLAFRPGAAPAIARRGTVEVVLAQPAASARGTVIAKISAPPALAAQPAEFFTVDPVSNAHAGEVAGYF